MKVFPLPIYSLSPKDPQRAVLLQVTDPHLFADTQTALLGVITHQSFQAVLSNIEAQDVPFDAILATGDISQDHSVASYHRFGESVARWSQPCFWLPGNHDENSVMASLAPMATIQSQKVILIGDHWVVVLLDSQVKGVPYGEVTATELASLREILSQYGDRHALVTLHHNPIWVGSHWLDQHALQNQAAFWETLSAFDNVKAVLCGHVHQQLDKYQGQIKVMSSPSTCIQFRPNSDEFALDEQNPGWRYLALNADGTIETQVHRLIGEDFRPKPDAKGY